MSVCIDGGPCVCVHRRQQNSGDTQATKTKSQDGRVCEQSYTHYNPTVLASSSSCIVLNCVQSIASLCAKCWYNRGGFSG